MVKKSFEIGVNAERLKKQQHQIKYETILFLQEKIVKTAQEKWMNKQPNSAVKFDQLYLSLNCNAVGIGKGVISLY